MNFDQWTKITYVGVASVCTAFRQFDSAIIILLIGILCCPPTPTGRD